MRSIQLCALALSAARTAHGYVDTSPFFMFSTSELLSSSSKLSSADAVTNDISTALSTCPSTHYIIISQSGVTANDYSSTSSPRSQIQRLSRDKTTIRSSTIIPDVIGEVDTSRWESTLKTHCNIQVQDLDASTGYIPAYASFPQAVRVTLPAPSTSNRAKDLAENDAFWASLLDMLPSSDYTVLFTTTPSGFTRQPSEPVHEYSMDSDSQQALHTEMKRALHANVVRKNSNETLPEGALFERYQFFTPGIYMGFLVGFLLLMILYVGISALSSLSVTYAAFDKDMGALAKTKAQ